MLLTFIRGIGQVLVTAGIVVLLFAVYELYGTSTYTNGAQDRLTDDLARRWNEPAQSPGSGSGSGSRSGTSPAASPSSRTGLPDASGEGEPGVEPDARGGETEPDSREGDSLRPPAGEGLAILRIPELGSDYGYAVVEGVEVAVLRMGPGHYPDSALPGEVGNFAVAGHRTTYGAPFNRLDELEAGDPIVVETRNSWFTYRVRSQQIVAPDAVGVVLPVPGQPDAVPVERLLTLTSCHPEFSARQRLIVTAALSETTEKVEGALPPALQAAG